MREEESWEREGREGESEEGRKRMRNRGREGKCGHLYTVVFFHRFDHSNTNSSIIH